MGSARQSHGRGDPPAPVLHAVIGHWKYTILSLPETADNKRRYENSLPAQQVTC